MSLMSCGGCHVSINTTHTAGVSAFLHKELDVVAIATHSNGHCARQTDSDHLVSVKDEMI